MACGSFRPQKCSGSAFRKHIMDKVKTSPATRPQPKHFDARPAIPTSDLRGAAEFYTRFPGDKPAEHPDWIRDRRAFREALDGMGDLRRWLHNKPILTDLEVLITERDSQDKRMSSPPSKTSIFPPPPDVTTSPRALGREAEEVKSFLRAREACNLSKFLDWYGTGKLKRVDLCALFKKDGLFIQPERMNVLMSSLNSEDGNSVTVENLAVGIQAWNGKHQEREEHKSNAGWNADHEKGTWTRHHLPTHGISLEEKDDEMGMQDVEVLAIMRRVLAATKTSCPSSLSGSTGREVDRFRTLCFREYLKSIEQCQRQGLNVSQATLQKVLLHPGDMSLSSSSKLGGKGHLSGCGGQEQVLTFLRTSKTHRVEGGANKGHKAMKKQSIRWADPNAFWPGKEDHVRLFLPVVTNSPAMVLFQRIDRAVAPSPGNWPVNHLGYSTSGDIEARKMYTL
ncbi:EF-hand calcium-binding domain-containing protein 12 [Rhinichthys klamathensis goyatoka]|uniref:EF-hand calcium-binding domain-containing protein 12 n=1 Tax=Rhinichthys klamathensis goyatoka TaxID=3034132 RepID=UPI0024B54B13|nr:EF-hand calcium-binding domain-containing protein 12 [Rhinichthys klamathensis goyatoka]